MPTLRPMLSWVKVWMASTKSASSGDSLSEGDMPSNSGPAGSRPEPTGNVSSELCDGKSENSTETYTGLLTCNPSDLLWTFQVAPSKPRNVCSKAVANQMNLFRWVLIAHLLKLPVLFIGDNTGGNGSGLFWFFSTRIGAHLKSLQEVSYVFPNRASALCCCGVVCLSQRQPVRNHHIDVYEV